MTPKVGAVVLIKDPLPRQRWRMARILSLRMSRDNVCRSVELRLSNGNVIVRSIKLLCPLEYSVDSDVGVAHRGALRKRFRSLNKHKMVSTVDEEAVEGGDSEASIEY